MKEDIILCVSIDRTHPKYAKFKIRAKLMTENNTLGIAAATTGFPLGDWKLEEQSKKLGFKDQADLLSKSSKIFSQLGLLDSNTAYCNYTVSELFGKQILLD